MFEQAKITLKHSRLKNFLISQLGYTDHSAEITISNLRNMHPDILKAFLSWFTTGVLPEGTLFGIDLRNLIRYRKVNPVSAFIAVDWYHKDPEKAYTVLALPRTDESNLFVNPEDESAPCRVRKYAVKISDVTANADDLTA